MEELVKELTEQLALLRARWAEEKHVARPTCGGCAVVASRMIAGPPVTQRR